MTRGEFSQFVRTEYERMIRFVRSRISNTADAEDVVQKTLLRLFMTCDVIDAHRPTGFVFAALKHAMTDYWRARGRGLRFTELPEQVSEFGSSSSIFPFDAGHLEQRGRDALRLALDSLTPRERQAFEVYWKAAGDRSEALALLGLADKDKNARFKTYDGPLHHARKKVAQTLAPHWDVLRGLSFHRTWQLVTEELARPAAGTVA